MRPDTSLTFRDLIVRVAEQGGVALYYDADNPADNSAKPPADPHDLQSCKDAVNDALREFYLRNPNWSFLKPEESLALTTDGTGPFNIDGDARRYRLSWYINGQACHGWVFGVGGSGAAMVRSVTPGELRMRALGQPDATGFPQYVAMMPATGVPLTTGERRGWEVQVWPKPDRAYTLLGDFDVEPAPLVALSDRVLCAARHDAAIIALCRAYYVRNRGPQELLPPLQAEADRLVALAIKFDEKQAPEVLPMMSDPGVVRRLGRTQDVYPMTQMTIDGVTSPASF